MQVTLSAGLPAAASPLSLRYRSASSTSFSSGEYKKCFFILGGDRKLVMVVVTRPRLHARYCSAPSRVSTTTAAHRGPHRSPPPRPTAVHRGPPPWPIAAHSMRPSWADVCKAVKRCERLRTL